MNSLPKGHANPSAMKRNSRTGSLSTPLVKRLIKAIRETGLDITGIGYQSDGTVHIQTAGAASQPQEMADSALENWINKHA